MSKRPDRISQDDLRDYFLEVYGFYTVSPTEPSESVKDKTVKLIIHAYHYRKSDYEDSSNELPA